MVSKQQLSIGYFIAVFVIMLAYQNSFVRQQVETLAYSEFKSALKAGRVIEVTLTDAAVTGKLSPGAVEVRSRVAFSGINPGDMKKRSGWQGSALCQ